MEDKDQMYEVSISEIAYDRLMEMETDYEQTKEMLIRNGFGNPKMTLLEITKLILEQNWTEDLT